jgi:hypothetical protein
LFVRFHKFNQTPPELEPHPIWLDLDLIAGFEPKDTGGTSILLSGFGSVKVAESAEVVFRLVSGKRKRR